MEIKFVPGQVWNYKTRPGEENSKLTILRVEPYHQLGDAIHISVSNVLTDSIGHMPFSAEAMKGSVTTLVSEGNGVSIENEGYDEWKKQEGGIFTISVAEAIDAIGKSIEQN